MSDTASMTIVQQATTAMVTYGELRIRRGSKYVAPGITVVEGPYENDYGRQWYGRVERQANGHFKALGSGLHTGMTDLGLHVRCKQAVEAILAYANERLTAAALQREFHNVTAGGVPVRFLRRAAGSIVCVMQKSTSSWGEDGYPQSIVMSAEKYANRESLRLVRR